MAAPIFKFKNVRVSLTTTANTEIYAVDIGKGARGLDIGVLPDEVSSVILTVQCSNKRQFAANKTISDTLNTGSTISDGVVQCNDVSDLTENMPVLFTGTTFGNIIAGTTYYVKEIDTNNNEFSISASRVNGIADTAFSLLTASGTMTAEFDSSVKITAQVIDLQTQTGIDLVKNYSVIANNAFDPLNGNLVLTSKLSLYVQTDSPNYVDVIVSLLEIANATAT